MKITPEHQIAKLQNENAQLHALLYVLVNDLGGQVAFPKAAVLQALLEEKRPKILEDKEDFEIISGWDWEGTGKG